MYQYDYERDDSFNFTSAVQSLDEQMAVRDFEDWEREQIAQERYERTPAGYDINEDEDDDN